MGMSPHSFQTFLLLVKQGFLAQGARERRIWSMYKKSTWILNRNQGIQELKRKVKLKLKWLSNIMKHFIDSKEVIWMD